MSDQKPRFTFEGNVNWLIATVITVGAATVLGVYYVTEKVMDTSLSGYELALTGQGATVSRIDERMSENFSSNQSRFNDMDQRFTNLDTSVANTEKRVTDDLSETEERLLKQMATLRGQNASILAQMQGLTIEFRGLRDELVPSSYEPEITPSINFRSPPEPIIVPEEPEPTVAPYEDVPVARVEPSNPDVRHSRRNDTSVSVVGDDSIIVLSQSGSVDRPRAQVAALDTANLSATTPRSNQRRHTDMSRSFHYLEHPAFQRRLERLIPDQTTVTIRYFDGKEFNSRMFAGPGQDGRPDLLRLAMLLDQGIVPGTSIKFDCSGAREADVTADLSRELIALCELNEISDYEFTVVFFGNTEGANLETSPAESGPGPIEISIRPKVRPADLR